MHAVCPKTEDTVLSVHNLLPLKEESVSGTQPQKKQSGIQQARIVYSPAFLNGDLEIIPILFLTIKSTYNFPDPKDNTSLPPDIANTDTDKI